MPRKCAGYVIRLTAAAMLLLVLFLSLHVDIVPDIASLEVYEAGLDFDDLELIPQVHHFDGPFSSGIRIPHSFSSPSSIVFISSIFRPPVV